MTEERIDAGEARLTIFGAFVCPARIFYRSHITDHMATLF